MTNHWNDKYNERLRVSLAQAKTRIAELEAHSESLAWSLLHALAKLDDALWTLERVNGRAQAPRRIEDWTPGSAVRALDEIQAMCQKALTK